MPLSCNACDPCIRYIFGSKDQRKQRLNNDEQARVAELARQMTSKPPEDPGQDENNDSAPENRDADAQNMPASSSGQDEMTPGSERRQPNDLPSSSRSGPHVAQDSLPKTNPTSASQKHAATQEPTVSSSSAQDSGSHSTSPSATEPRERKSSPGKFDPELPSVPHHGLLPSAMAAISRIGLPSSSRANEPPFEDKEPIDNAYTVVYPPRPEHIRQDWDVQEVIDRIDRYCERLRDAKPTLQGVCAEIARLRVIYPKAGETLRIRLFLGSLHDFIKYLRQDKVPNSDRNEIREIIIALEWNIIKIEAYGEQSLHVVRVVADRDTLPGIAEQWYAWMKRTWLEFDSIGARMWSFSVQLEDGVVMSEKGKEPERLDRKGDEAQEGKTLEEIEYDFNKFEPSRSGSSRSL